MAIQNAIVSQHTLYPYHFIINSQKLNKLGLRDFGVLAANFKENPGDLNISRGDVTEQLYQARVNNISRMLQDKGVNADRINIQDGMPGGTGIGSESVLKILEKSLESPAEKSSSSRGRTSYSNK